MEQKKVFVICDTNVWYNLSNSGYNKYKTLLANYQLCTTDLSFFELISSPALQYDFQKIKKILKVMEEASAVIIGATDILHILLKLGVNIEAKDLPTKDDFQTFYTKFVNAQSEKELPFNYKKIINKRKRYSNKIAFMYTCLTFIWSLSNKSIEYIQDYLRSSLKKQMDKYVRFHNLKITGGPNAGELQKKFEKVTSLYVTCFSHFLYEVEKSYFRKNRIKIKGNDYIDFRNLLYCAEKDKYLTFERSTSKKIGGMLHLYGHSYELDCTDQLRKISIQYSQQ